MTDRPRDIPTMLRHRLGLVQAIAAANCECLRLNQIASGMMVLDQKDEIDGAADDRRDGDRNATGKALEASMTTISELEAELADLDRELATAIEREQE